MKKSVSNTKWILTTSLLAVLVTQYSFQTSSLALAQRNDSGEFSFASTADQQPKDETTKKDDIKKTEANVTAEAACKDCSTSATSTKAPTIEELLAKITNLEKMLTEAQAKKTEEVAQNPESDCEPARSDETYAEKRERIKCQKEEKAQAKLEKEKEKILARVDKFEEKVDKLQDRCESDLECLSSGFTSLLSSYEGRNALPTEVVNKAFKSTVGNELNKAMFSGDQEKAMTSSAALQNLLQEMPEQYKKLKETVVNNVKTQTQLAANQVNAGYAELNTLSKANNPEAYLEAAQNVQAQHTVVNSLANMYSSSIVESIKTSQDNSMYSYYMKSYLPDMKKIMSAIGTGVSTTTTETTLDKTTNSRDSRNGSVTNTNNNIVTTSTVDNSNKMTNVNANTNTWLLSNDSTGIQVGSPQDTTRGGRGAK